MYVITNTDNGKLYVGSATGRNGIYQRWKNYIDNGHGGNTELRKLVEQQEKRT
ncbi:GIY-YIG nuclease family protein [Bifidobacterium adolescentis]|uniref:GIY-YIG nuclease family protein n=1 Tax=Bifidobacterium adolescentis TaxID=1680 RepID=UPI0034DD4A0D